MSTTTTPELTPVQRLEDALERSKSGNFTVFFFVPDTSDMPSGAIIELHEQALALQKGGYNIKLITEVSGKGKLAYAPPRYLDPELQNLPHIPADTSVQMAAYDWLVIPDFYSALLLQTQGAAVGRIVLAQTYDYVSRGLVGGYTWRSHGVNFVLATSNKLKEFIDTWHGEGRYEIEVAAPAVPDYFKGSKVRQPYVAIHSRNEADAERISKLFYLKYPHLGWITFRDLHGLTRKEYAKVLGKAACCVWVDRIAGFGQTPVEAMSTGTPVIALAPDVIPEYMVEHAGFWTQDFYEIPQLVGKFMEHWLVKGTPEKVQVAMANVASNYTREKTGNQVVNAFNTFVQSRQGEFTYFLNKHKKEAEASTVTNA